LIHIHPHAHINPPPSSRKRFHMEHVRRIPVQLTEAAKEAIDGSTRQGRVFPQALSEFFGTLPEVEQIEIDVSPDKRLMIDIKHKHEHKHYRFFIGVDDLHQKSGNPRDSFDAAKTANELLRLYRVHVLQEV